MVPRLLLALLLLASLPTAKADIINESYAFAILGTPKYGAGFSHFDYVNPAAPKGGTLRQAALGTYDNFNRFAMRGNPAARSGQLYDTLFVASSDEIGSYYPLVAESARYPDSLKWVEVAINPRARFQDGIPVTARDLSFTFQKFMTEGVPQFRLFYKGVKVAAISRLTVRFEFPTPDRDQVLGLLGGLPVLPAHYWQQHKLSDPLPAPPLGGGPYQITDYRLGQYVVYSRVRDYWAADLPVNRGRFNLDTLRYDYFLDDKVALQAFKAGSYDFRSEGSPKSWATQYTGPNFSKNYIAKRDEESEAAQDTRWLAFNTQRPLFRDRRVREAIGLAFDFEWMNRALFYGAYQRADSYFQNTEYAARSYPDAAELAWLGPLKGKVPPEVFTTLYQPPRSDGSGNDRANLLKATALLREAGYEVRDQRLVDARSGAPFQFELLLPAGGNNQFVLPFQHNLQRLGITLTLREVDNSQFLSRLRSRDYDMLPTLYRAMQYPNGDLLVRWASGYLDSSYNAPGVQDPAIDQLIEAIVRHQGQPTPLRALGRALDRVLTWQQLMIPMWYSKRERYAYWDKFSQPAIRPLYGMDLDCWWYDVNKAARLPAERR